MSQKSQNVFSRKSEPKEPTDEELKREIFANLPLAVFRDFTNVRTLITDKYRQLQDGKEPTIFYVNRKTEEFYNKLSKTDVHDASLKELEFIGSKSDRNGAKIWLLSKREQKRIYAHSTKQQKKFLYLPKNVLRHATNFEELVRAAASERGAAQPGKFIDDIFNSLHQIEHWIPALSNLKFHEQPNAPPIDENDDKSNPNKRSGGNTPFTPRRPQKRVNRVTSIDDDKMFEIPSQPAKRRRSVRLQSKDVNDEDDEHQAATAKTKNESKIPLIDKKRKSKASEMVFLGPNQFQLKVQNLNVEDFVVKTNIKSIILSEYRDEVHDSNANIPEEMMTKRLLDYNSKRMDGRQWKRTGLKNLKFIDENESNRNSVTPRQRSTNASAPPMTANSGDKNPNRSQLNMNGKSQSICSTKAIEPNDFQKEIMSMSYEIFINETNVKELVRKYIESETEPLTDAAMEIELKKLDQQRYHFKRFYKGLLNHLKILKCECRRNKTFQDKWTQTDMIPSQDTEAQCDSLEESTNETTVPVQNDQSHTSCQSKLSMLTVHEITESEIIQIESVSSTFVADTATANEPQAEHASNDSDHAHEFVSPNTRIEMAHDIEDILASFEMGYDVEEHPDRIVDAQAQTEIAKSVTDDQIQPDSLADGIIMANTDFPNEFEVIPQSEVVDYTVECEVVSENIPDQHDEEQNATAVDSLVYEANFIDPEISMESDTDENQLNSTQPAGISGENEPVANVETSCLQIESIIGDVDAENSCGSNEHSYAREQGSNNSSELVDSFHVNSFEPNEKSTPKSTPKSTNEAKCDENIQQTPCQTSKKDHEKTNLPKEVQKRARNPLENITKMRKLIDGLRQNDKIAVGRLCDAIIKR